MELIRLRTGYFKLTGEVTVGYRLLGQGFAQATVKETKHRDFYFYNTEHMMKVSERDDTPGEVKERLHKFFEDGVFDADIV